VTGRRLHGQSWFPAESPGGLGFSAVVWLFAGVVLLHDACDDPEIHGFGSEFAMARYVPSQAGIDLQ